MATYYHRSVDTGEIVNASESSLSLPELEKRYPLDEGWYYDPNPPLHALERYEFWHTRP